MQLMMLCGPLVGSRDEEACKTKLSMLGNQAIDRVLRIHYKGKSRWLEEVFVKKLFVYCKRLKEFAQAAEKAQFVFTHNTVGHLLTITTLRPNI